MYISPSVRLHKKLILFRSKILPSGPYLQKFQTISMKDFQSRPSKWLMNKKKKKKERGVQVFPPIGCHIFPADYVSLLLLFKNSGYEAHSKPFFQRISKKKQVLS